MAKRTPAEQRVYRAAPGEASDVELMPAGDVTEGVVRVGGTIRRPHQPQSFAVADYLDWLENAGFEGSPRFLGRDSDGRDVLTFLPRPVRQDTLAGDPARLVCHLDVTPQNVVVRDGRAVGLVDFDLARPSTALRDSFNTAMHWVALRDPVGAWPGWEELDPFRRLRIFADAYGWSEHERRRLPQFGVEAVRLSLERMEHNARTLGGGWARMWEEGVGGLIERRAAWLEANATRLVRALTD